MTISALSLLFDCALALLLSVMIYYAVVLNRRITVLRERESEMQDMIVQFNASSELARASAQKLRSAGAEAETLVKAAIAKGMTVREDLGLLIDRAEIMSEMMESPAAAASLAGRPAPRPRSQAAPTARADAAERDGFVGPPVRASAPPATAPVAAPPRNVKPFMPPPRAKSAVVNPAPAADSGPAPRTEAEQQLLAAIRAAKQGVA